ncbi:MAG: hypothetical protein OXF49_00665 [Candidatus Saccharibacteria bacterium]|nr:hypothetical protein [Candidatus Saccharibacteria bacterium]
MITPESSYHQIHRRDSQEILSDLSDCYDILDSQQQVFDNLINKNRQFRQEYTRDLQQLAELQIISVRNQRLKRLQYNLEFNIASEVPDTQSYNTIKQSNFETDLEILKYRQARSDISHNQISILCLDPDVVKPILYDPTIHAGLLENVKDTMKYMWQYTKIPANTLNRFEETHSLDNIVAIKRKRSDQSLNIPSDQINYDYFRLVALHYLDDWKIDLEKLSIFHIAKEVMVMTSLTNKTFKTQLETQLIHARLHGILDNQQLRVLQNYYHLTDGFDINPDKYHSNIKNDLTLVRQFDINNP